MPRPAPHIAGFLLSLVLVLFAQASQAADWVTVTGDGRFTVQMPAAPQEEIEMIDGGAGNIPMHIYLSQIGDDVGYGVFYTDFDETLLRRTTPQKFLLSGQRGAVQKTKTTVRSSRQIQLGRWPGLSFVADNAQIVYTSNTYLVANRLYQLVVVTTKEASDDRGIAKFFGSFDVGDK